MMNEKKVKKRYIAAILIICIVTSLSLCGCSNSGSVNQGSSPDYITKSGFLLNTDITISIYDKQDNSILNDCFDLISRYEGIYSRTLKTSELYALNNRTAAHEGNAYKISDEMSDILSKGLYYSRLSGGVFDISIEPLSSLWGFTAKNPTVPAKADIRAALPYVNYRYIHLNGNTITFDKEKTGIDLGGIAKGYIADKLKEFLLSKGVHSAMINLGGNILCIGEKPVGIPFHVGVQKPFADRNEIIGYMDINGLSVVSSGVYERCFTVNGKLYHHILNPKTGYPFDNGLISVTIISKKSTDGDGLSTTCFALGLKKGMELIERLPDTYAIFITSDYKLHYSKGFKNAVKFKLE